MSCDSDGWVLKVNNENDFPTFFHIIQVQEIQSIDVFGDVEISYIGFGGESKGHYRLILVNIIFQVCSRLLLLDLI